MVRMQCSLAKHVQVIHAHCNLTCNCNARLLHKSDAVTELHEGACEQLAEAAVQQHALPVGREATLRHPNLGVPCPLIAAARRLSQCTCTGRCHQPPLLERQPKPRILQGGMWWDKMSPNHTVLTVCQVCWGQHIAAPHPWWFTGICTCTNICSNNDLSCNVEAPTFAKYSHIICKC